MAILADTVGQAGIGSAMGFVTMNIALGVVSGPTLGGILYHHFGYLAVFVSAYALVGLDFLLRVLMLGKEDREKGKNNIRRNQMDYGTASSKPCRPARSPSTSSSSSSSSLLSSTSSSPTSSLPSPESRHLAKIQAKPHRHPLLTLLTTPRMLTAILGDFTQATILTSLESILPLRTKLLFHYNSQRVALVFLPLSLAPLFGPLFGALSDRIGAKTMVCTGFLLTAPLLILLRLVDHYDESQVALLCVLLFLIGISLNMILTPVFSEASYVVDDLVATQPGVFGEKGAYAQAFRLMNVAYAAGSVVGPLMGGFLVERIGREGVTCGMGIWCLGCVGPCFWATGGRRTMEGRSEDGGGGDEI